MSAIAYKREPTQKQLEAWARRDAKRRASVSARFVRFSGVNVKTGAIYVMHRVSRLERHRTRCGMKILTIVGVTARGGMHDVEWFEALPEGVETLYCTHKGCFPDHVKPV